MWKIDTTSGWKNSYLDFETQHPEETAHLLRNLAHYTAQLKISKNHKALEALYLQRRESGIVTIDQKGMEDGLMDCRIYAFPDESNKTLYLLCVGKETEKDSDMEYCKNFLFYLANERA
ncbi:MAG: hypothetical protein WAO02_14840 [Verrucomicrobiia bacterium]